MMNEITWHKNVKYAPGYVSIKNVKNNYTHKNNIAKHVNNVKNTARLTLINDESYLVNFSGLESREENKAASGHRARQLSTPIKIFTALIAVTLLSGISADAQRFSNNDGGEEGIDNFGAVKWEFDPNYILDQGNKFTQEAELAIGVNTLNKYDNTNAEVKTQESFSETISRVRLYMIKQILITDLDNTYKDFDDTVFDNREAYETSSPSKQSKITERINGLERAKEGLLTLREEFIKIETSVNKSSKTKAGLLISKINVFIDKHDKESNIWLVTQGMKAMCESLRRGIERLKAV